jgi:hypothetical protein
VWAGYLEGLDFNSIARLQDADGVEVILVGTATGLVLEMFSGFKDSRAVGAVTGTDVSYEVRSREETLSPGVGRTMRVKKLLPTMYQKHNGAWNLQYIVNRSQLLPSTAKTIKFTGRIPYWHDGSDPKISSKWNNTVWTAKPTLTATINVGKQANSILFIFKMSGSNVKQEGSWVSYDLHVQRLPTTRRKAAA